jgi:hypothetical protein
LDINSFQLTELPEKENARLSELLNHRLSQADEPARELILFSNPRGAAARRFF